MEQLLRKLAHQLDAIDEASLLSLWDKYAAIVRRFEPTRQWEEAALVFCLIQGKRWKNQLFNQCWAQQARPRQDAPGGGAPGLAPFDLEGPAAESAEVDIPQKRCKVLSFRPSKDK